MKAGTLGQTGTDHLGAEARKRKETIRKRLHAVHGSFANVASTGRTQQRLKVVSDFGSTRRGAQGVEIIV